MPSFTVSRTNALVAVAVALVAVFTVAHFLAAPATDAQPAANPGGAGGVPALTTPTATTPTAPSVVVVDVAGAVRHPGVYRLPPGSRIADAIARAGGVARGADSSLVDLAAPLADGEQVLVPAAAAGTLGAVPTAAAGATAAPPTAPVDLNTASAEQLDALPGIGPVTAQKIVDYRTQHGPFTSVDDLDAIPGIGPSRIDNLRSLVIP